MKSFIVNITLTISSYLLIFLWSFMIVDRYFVNHKWNEVIGGLGDHYTKRCFMSIHFAGGIFCMLMYCDIDCWIDIYIPV